MLCVKELSFNSIISGWKVGSHDNHKIAKATKDWKKMHKNLKRTLNALPGILCLDCSWRRNPMRQAINDFWDVWEGGTVSGSGRVGGTFSSSVVDPMSLSGSLSSQTSTFESPV